MSLKTPVSPVVCECADCDKPAVYRAGQSTDQGASVTHMLICEEHANYWNEDGDWKAPIIKITK